MLTQLRSLPLNNTIQIFKRFIARRIIYERKNIQGHQFFKGNSILQYSLLKLKYPLSCSLLAKVITWSLLQANCKREDVITFASKLQERGYLSLLAKVITWSLLKNVLHNPETDH